MWKKNTTKNSRLGTRRSVRKRRLSGSPKMGSASRKRIEVVATFCAGWSQTSQKPVQPINQITPTRATPVTQGSQRAPVNLRAKSMRPACTSRKNITRSEP